jgi:hypothetical protein
MRENPEDHLPGYLLYVVLAIAVSAVIAIIALGNFIGNCMVGSGVS